VFAARFRSSSQLTKSRARSIVSQILLARSSRLARLILAGSIGSSFTIFADPDLFTPIPSRTTMREPIENHLTDFDSHFSEKSVSN